MKSLVDRRYSAVVHRASYMRGEVGNLKAVADLPYRKAEEAKSMPLDMQPLSDKFGVAITNVDLSKELDETLR